MALCSLEEAWGADFKTNNQNKSTPKYNQTYKRNNAQRKKNKYSRDVIPLENHNGVNRVPLRKNVHFNDNEYQEQNYYNNNNNNNNNNNYETEEDSEYAQNTEDVEDVEDTEDEEYTEEDMETNDNTTTDEYYNYDGELTTDEDEDQYGEYDTEEYDDVYTDDDYKPQNEMSTEETTHTQQIPQRYDGYRENGSQITVNISNLMEKVNKLVDYFENNCKKNGAENQDVFLFVVIGIFIIFLMDLIFRIAVKINKT